jgi:hypothetical protein
MGSNLINSLSFFRIFIYKRPMAKIIKLKQSDIENIVNEIVDESPEMDSDNNQSNDQSNDSPALTLGQDADGNYYVFKDGLSGNPEIVAKS